MSTTTPVRAEQGAVQMSPTGWQPRHELSFDEWTGLGVKLGIMGRAHQWWIGDWINYGEALYGEKYTQAIDVLGYDIGSLMNMAYVASRFEISLRSEIVSWSHHKAIAALESGQRKAWLDRIKAEGLTLAQLNEALRSGQTPDPALEPGRPPRELPARRTTTMTVARSRWAAVAAEFDIADPDDVDEIVLRRDEE